MGSVAGTERRRAEAVFNFLHRALLVGGYRLECTDLRRTLDEGHFNCVSASVLFNCLAAEFGVSAGGLETPGHAMSRLHLADGPLNVETTCPRWFQLLDHPQEQAAAVAKTRGSRPARDPRSLREVSPVQLTAMIYYNRGVDLLAEKNFAAAAEVNARALRLDPANATARGNFLATINNWAIELGSVSHYAEAAGLLRLGQRIEPGYEAFAANFVHLYGQWADDLCAAGRFDEAWRLLAQAAAERPDEAFFRRAQARVAQRWNAAETP